MVKVKCHICGNQWDYTGNADMATCPNCSRKTPVNHEQEEATA